MRIVLATCLNIPEPDFDEPFMLDALRAAGHEVEVCAWDSPSVAWEAFELCLVRSTWNYYLDPNGFRDWIHKVDAATTIANPAKILLDNLDKRYLAHLESKGTRIIPTEWLSRGDSADLAEIINRRGWSDVGVVIKPTISAGSWNTRRAETAEHGQAFLNESLQERDMMVQRFMPSVASGGERSLVRIGEVFTHAIEKMPRFDGEDESVSDAMPVQTQEIELAERILDDALGSAKANLTYARVDLIRDDHGQAMLSELELIEPSLFLKQAPHSRDAFARAVTGIGVR